jgi:polyisoprenoid-binding protein YceI
MLMDRNNRFQTSFVGTAALLALASLSLVADAKLAKAGSSTAGFKASGPAGLAIEGRTSDVVVEDDGTNVRVTVKLSNIDTGLELRNRHTKEDLEVDKFPTATIVVARSLLKLGGGDGDAKGSLTIHGQTKDVTFHYNAANNGGTLDVKSSTRIGVSDFGVKPRSYLGVSIKNDVDIYANFQAKDN